MDFGRIRLTRRETNYFHNHDTAMIGNHDFPSLKEFTDNIFEKPKLLEQKADILAKELNLDATEKAKIQTDKTEFMKHQFVNLFLSPVKHIQVFFVDLFGRNESYNRANLPDPMNWRTRISQTYKQEYYKGLINNEGLNIPETLEMAIKIGARKNNQPVPEQLIDKLHKFNAILKEPE